MSATAIIPSTARSTTQSPTQSTTQSRSLSRAAVVAGLAAAAATAVAAVAQAVGVSFETEPGKAIPLLGFAQLTLFCTAIGALLARGLRGRAQEPRSTFVKTTVVLTALSLVPDAILSASAAAKATLVLTHLVAAAIVIPALSACLPERRRS